jgi:hypothetical protein
MKKQLLLSLLILALGISGAAQKAAKQSKAEKNIRAHVSYLTSDELEGRRTGEKGATFAAGYVSNMFQRYKLNAGYKEADGTKSFLQPFDYIAGVKIDESSSMILGGKTNLKMRSDWTPYVYSPSADLPSNTIEFALHGISSARLGHDDYKGLDVKGKIVAVLAGAPDGGNPRSPFARFNIFAKANVAKDKGAVALIVIAAEDELSKDRRARMNFNQTLGQTAIPVVVVSRAVGAQFLNLKAAADLSKVEKWLESKPESAYVRFENLKPSNAVIKIDIQKQKAEAYNVIGIIEGRDKVLKNEAIVIGAHYDHLGRGGDGSLAPNSKDIHHGADDNASGTSAMLELARQFRKEKKNRRTIIFISFGGEEEGLLGSKAYVNNPVFPMDKTIAMVNMDMVGRLKEQKLTIGGIGTAEVWNDMVTNNNRRVPNVYGKKAGNKKASFTGSKEEVELFKLQLNQDGFGPSDHASFYGAKIPVLFFFTGTHSDYHKPSDTAEKINYTGLEKIATYVGEIVRILDRNPTRPIYKKAKAAPNAGGRRTFNVSLGTIPGYGDSDNTGLLLEGVRDGSPAQKAGLKGGDKIVKIGGKDIRNITDYVFMLGELKAGETYDVVVMRGGEKLNLKIIPAPRSR